MTVTISATFLSQLGLTVLTQASLGLLIGGIVAAPFGAMLAKRVDPKLLLLFVGVVLTATSLLNLWPSHMIEQLFG